MFQFRRFPAYAYLIQRTLTRYCRAGLPHSEIHGSRPICGSPWLIAACHVLRRLLMPRHSPCALYSLTFTGAGPFRPATYWSRIMQAHRSSQFGELLLPFPRTAFAILNQSSTTCLHCPLLLALHLHLLRCSVFKVQTFWLF